MTGAAGSGVIHHIRYFVRTAFRGLWASRATSGVAIATIERSHWDAGTTVLVETPDGIRTAAVCTLPFA